MQDLCMLQVRASRVYITNKGTVTMQRIPKLSRKKGEHEKAKFDIQAKTAGTLLRIICLREIRIRSLLCHKRQTQRNMYVGLCQPGGIR